MLCVRSTKIVKKFSKQLVVSFNTSAVRRSEELFNHRDTPDNNPDTPFEFTDANLQRIASIIQNYPTGHERAALIPTLDIAQRQIGWLPLSAMHRVAEVLSVPRMRVYEVASFYTMFKRRYRGKYHVKVCGTTPCWLRGAEDIMNAAIAATNCPEGGLSPCGTFGVDTVECAGACANAPVLVVDDDYYEDVTPYDVHQIIDCIRSGGIPPAGPRSGRGSCEPFTGPTTLLSPPPPPGSWLQPALSGGPTPPPKPKTPPTPPHAPKPTPKSSCGMEPKSKPSGGKICGGTQPGPCRPRDVKMSKEDSSETFVLSHQMKFDLYDIPVNVSIQKPIVPIKVMKYKPLPKLHEPRPEAYIDSNKTETLIKPEPTIEKTNESEPKGKMSDPVVKPQGGENTVTSSTDPDVKTQGAKKIVSYKIDLGVKTQDADKIMSSTSTRIFSPSVKSEKTHIKMTEYNDTISRDSTGEPETKQRPMKSEPTISAFNAIKKLFTGTYAEKSVLTKPKTDMKLKTKREKQLGSYADTASKLKARTGTKEKMEQNSLKSIATAIQIKENRLKNQIISKTDKMPSTMMKSNVVAPKKEILQPALKEEIKDTPEESPLSAIKKLFFSVPKESPTDILPKSTLKCEFKEKTIQSSIKHTPVAVESKEYKFKSPMKLKPEMTQTIVKSEVASFETNQKSLTKPKAEKILSKILKLDDGTTSKLEIKKQTELTIPKPETTNTTLRAVKKLFSVFITKKKSGAEVRTELIEQMKQNTLKSEEMKRVNIQRPSTIESEKTYMQKLKQDITEAPKPIEKPDIKEANQVPKVDTIESPLTSIKNFFTSSFTKESPSQKGLVKESLKSGSQSHTLSSSKLKIKTEIIDKNETKSKTIPSDGKNPSVLKYHAVSSEKKPVKTELKEQIKKSEIKELNTVSPKILRPAPITTSFANLKLKENIDKSAIRSEPQHTSQTKKLDPVVLSKPETKLDIRSYLPQSLFKSATEKSTDKNAKSHPSSSASARATLLEQMKQSTQVSKLEQMNQTTQESVQIKPEESKSPFTITKLLLGSSYEKKSPLKSHAHKKRSGSPEKPSLQMSRLETKEKNISAIKSELEETSSRWSKAIATFESKPAIKPDTTDKIEQSRTKLEPDIKSSKLLKPDDDMLSKPPTKPDIKEDNLQSSTKLKAPDVISPKISKKDHDIISIMPTKIKPETKENIIQSPTKLKHEETSSKMLKSDVLSSKPLFIPKVKEFIEKIPTAPEPKDRIMASKTSVKPEIKRKSTQTKSDTDLSGSAIALKQNAARAALMEQLKQATFKSETTAVEFKCDTPVKAKTEQHVEHYSSSVDKPASLKTDSEFKDSPPKMTSKQDKMPPDMTSTALHSFKTMFTESPAVKTTADANQIEKPQKIMDSVKILSQIQTKKPEKKENVLQNLTESESKETPLKWVKQEVNVSSKSTVKPEMKKEIEKSPEISELTLLTFKKLFDDTPALKLINPKTDADIKHTCGLDEIPQELSVSETAKATKQIVQPAVKLMHLQTAADIKHIRVIDKTPNKLPVSETAKATEQIVQPAAKLTRPQTATDIKHTLAPDETPKKLSESVSDTEKAAKKIVQRPTDSVPFEISLKWLSTETKPDIKVRPRPKIIIPQSAAAVRAALIEQMKLATLKSKASLFGIKLEKTASEKSRLDVVTSSAVKPIGKVQESPLKHEPQKAATEKSRLDIVTAKKPVIKSQENEVISTKPLKLDLKIPTRLTSKPDVKEQVKQSAIESDVPLSILKTFKKIFAEKSMPLETDADRKHIDTQDQTLKTTLIAKKTPKPEIKKQLIQIPTEAEVKKISSKWLKLDTDSTIKPLGKPETKDIIEQKAELPESNLVTFKKLFTSEPDDKLALSQADADTKVTPTPDQKFVKAKTKESLKDIDLETLNAIKKLFASSVSNNTSAELKSDQQRGLSEETPKPDPKITKKRDSREEKYQKLSEPDSEKVTALRTLHRIFTEEPSHEQDKPGDSPKPSEKTHQDMALEADSAPKIVIKSEKMSKGEPKKPDPNSSKFKKLFTADPTRESLLEVEKDTEFRPPSKSPAANDKAKPKSTEKATLNDSSSDTDPIPPHSSNSTMEKYTDTVSIETRTDKKKLSETPCPLTNWPLEEIDKESTYPSKEKKDKTSQPTTPTKSAKLEYNLDGDGKVLPPPIPIQPPRLVPKPSQGKDKESDDDPERKK